MSICYYSLTHICGYTRVVPAVRRPKQYRAQKTVEAILDAVTRVLAKGGATAVTTNRIAEIAGVSIGSVYQYFPDKGAIFSALHDRHVEEMSRLVERTLVEHAAASLEALIRALVEAVVAAHATDPALYELLRVVPHVPGAPDFAVRLRGALRLALAARASELGRRRDLDALLFVVTNQIDSLCHAAVLRRPPRLSLAAAKDEAVRAVLAYLHAR
jgi:AcrR family transcriptional regulator